MSTSKRKPAYLEVKCPECGRLFKSEEQMIEHLESKHEMSTKENPILGFEATYLGGHPANAGLAYGYLYIFSGQNNRIVFESENLTFEIPISRIKNVKAATEKEVSTMRVLLVGILALGWQKENKMYLIQFEDELGEMETVIFEHSGAMTEFGKELYNLRLKMKSSNFDEKNYSTITKEIVKEVIIKVRCPYCKFTYDEAFDKCPHCGAKT